MGQVSRHAEEVTQATSGMSGISAAIASQVDNLHASINVLGSMLKNGKGTR